MKYDDWYEEGIRNGYLKNYTLSTLKGLFENIEMLKRACSQSVMDNLDEDVTKKIKYEGDRYWLNIQMEMMTEDSYWKSKLNE